MRSISVSDIIHYQFAKTEVLADEHARITRMFDLNGAQAVTNLEHEEVGLIVRLETGEDVEILSDLIDVGTVHVEVKGGHLIPITAILRVEI